MKIEFQYFDACPNWQLTHERLLVAIEASPTTIDVEMVLLDSPEDAAQIGFRGSPSMVVADVDLFDDDDAPAVGSWSCRFYGTTDGAPTVAALSTAIAAVSNQ